MKPIIGVTSFDGTEKVRHSVSNTYIDAVFAAGGIPAIIPVIYDEEDYDNYLDMLDGIIFTGGLDVSPLCYNENPLKEINLISSRRDKYELGLVKKAYERKMPILGICRGLQITNVALGGSLYQDINVQVSDSLGHAPRGISNDELYHSIEVKKDTKLYDIFGKEKIFVNSFHHQSIKDLGENLVVSALSEDGIIEAMEATDERFLIGLQFHPEALVKRHPEYLNIFKELVLAAKTK